MYLNIPEVVHGSVINGNAYTNGARGFTYTRQQAGYYIITFSAPLASAPDYVADTTELIRANNEVAMGLAFDPMNRLVVAGFSRPPGTNEPKIVLMRYDNGGAMPMARMSELVGMFTAECAIDNQASARR
jgi:hypothetical protein